MDASKTGTRRFNWQLALVIVLALVVLGGTLYGLRKWRRTYRATHALETGMKAFQAKQWSTAISDLGVYCSLHPKEIDPLLKYAEAEMNVYPQKEANVKQAVAAYRRVLGQDPTHPDAADRVAEIYLQTGMPGDAEAVVGRRLAARDDPYARELLAMAQAGQRKFKEAAEALVANMQKYPSRVNSYLLLADLMRTRSDVIPGKPLDMIRAAVKANPNSAEAHIALGAYLVQWGASKTLKDEGLAQLAAAKSLDLSDPKVRVKLADRLLTVGDAAGAREQLVAASQIDPSLHDLWSTWAALARTYGTTDEARQVAKAGLAALGTDSGTFLPTAAELYLYGKDDADAKAVIDKMEKIDPLSDDIPMIKGLYAQYRGNLSDAIKFWRVSADMPNAPLEIKLSLARAYEAADDTTAAISELRAIVAADPYSVEAQTRLAKDLSLVGNWWEAAQRSAQAVRLSPDSADARVVDLTVRAHLAEKSINAKKDLEALSAEVARLRQAAPADPRFTVLAAQVAAMRGDVGAVQELVKNLQADETTRYEAAMVEVGALWATGRHKEALVAMQSAVNQFSRRTDAVERLADLLVAEGQKDAAVEAVKRALLAADASSTLRLQLALARIYLGTGDASNARDVLRRASRDNPSDVTSRLLLLNAYGEKEADAAQAIVDEIKQIEGSASSRWRYAQAALWLNGPQWQSNQAAVVSLLSENVKSDPYDLDSQLLLGVAYEKTGNMRLAIETYKGAYERNPESAPVVFHLVSALQKTNDLDGAEGILAEAAKHGIAGDKLAGLRLGQDMRQGKTDLAVATAQDMLARDPGNVSLQVFIARIKISQGAFDEAAAILDRMSASDTNVAMTKIDLLLQRKQPDAALAECDKLVESAKNVTAHLARARARTIVGKYDQAEEDYREAARIGGDKAECWVLLADFLAARHKNDEAIKAIVKALGVEKNDPAAALRADRLYGASADPATRKKGREILDAAIAAHPQDVDLMLYKTRSLLAAGTADSLDQAHKALSDLTRLNPDRVDVWATLARTSLQQGMVDESLDAVARAIAADAQGKDRRTLLFLKAEAEKVRWPALAAATLKGLYDSNRQDVGAGVALAAAYRDAGDNDKAVALLKTLVQSADAAQAAQIEISLIDALDAQGNHAEALQRASGLAARLPDDSRPAVLISILQGRADKWDAATATLFEWQDKHPKDSTALLEAATTFRQMASGLSGRDTAGSAEHSAAARQAALTILEGAFSRHPQELAIRENLASAYQTSGQVDKAEALYRKILAESGDQDVIINNLAWLLCEDRKKPAEALSLADRGRKLYPDMTDLMDTRGVIYERLGRLDDAKLEYDLCIKTAPAVTPQAFGAKLHKARVLALEKRKQDAMVLLNDILSRTPCLLSPADKAEGQALLDKLTAQVVLPAR